MSSVYKPLESCRIAKYAVGVPCYICGEGNSCDGELCRHCHAPLALARQASVKKFVRTCWACSDRRGQAKRSIWACCLICFRGRPTICNCSPAWRILDFFAANGSVAFGALRVSRQNAERARPLELGACPELTPPAANAWN